MHRDQARRAAGRARLAAVGLGVAGAAVLFAPFPKLGVAPAGQPSGVAPTPPVAGTAPGAAPVDTEMWKRVAIDAGPEPRPPAPPPDEVQPDEVVGIDGEPMPPDEEPVSIAGGPTLRYLGPIVGPRRTLAMVALDGNQQIVAVGEAIDGKTVREVGADRIVLDDAQGVEHVITMAEQVKDWDLESPSPRARHSKSLGPTGRGNIDPADGRDREQDPTLSDIDHKRQMAEAARRLAEQERGGANDEPPIAVPPRNTTTPSRPTGSTPATAKPPNRGVNAVTPVNPNGQPRTPPARPTAPTKGKLDEKKVGNEV